MVVLTWTQTLFLNSCTPVGCVIVFCLTYKRQLPVESELLRHVHNLFSNCLVIEPAISFLSLGPKIPIWLTRRHLIGIATGWRVIPIFIGVVFFDLAILIQITARALSQIMLYVQKLLLDFQTFLDE